jgi:hypothetical protein
MFMGAMKSGARLRSPIARRFISWGNQSVAQFQGFYRVCPGGHWLFAAGPYRIYYHAQLTIIIIKSSLFELSAVS